MSDNSKKLVLCGCGWLGGYLANHFSNEWQITGTTRHQTKATELQNNGVQPLLFALGDATDTLIEACANSIVILNIPPGRRNQNLDAFTRQMCDLITALYQNPPPKKLIFISTTSVYGNQQGDITTASPVAPTTASGETHIAIEQHIGNTAPNNGYILRLAGLTGPDRHPAKTLSGRTLTGANQPVNLVHVYDVINTIEALMVQQPQQKLWHLCSSEHPVRGEYYPAIAEEAGLEAIEFTDKEKVSDAPEGKTINPQATLTELGITLHFPSPWQMKPV